MEVTGKVSIERGRACIQLVPVVSQPTATPRPGPTREEVQLRILHGQLKVHESRLPLTRPALNSMLDYIQVQLNLPLFIKVQGCKTHTSTFCHRSLFLGDGKIHEGHLSKQRMIWGKSMDFCSTSLHIKVQGCKTHTSTFCHRSLFLGDGKVPEGHVGKQRLIRGKWMHFCSILHQGSRLQNLHFNLLHGATI